VANPSPDNWQGFREILLAQLAADLLGPRDGPHEKMPVRVGTDMLTPLSEYVTGILAPHASMPEGYSESGEDHATPEGYSESGEDDYYEAEVFDALAAGTLVSPQRPPSSMGLEFAVERTSPDADAKLSICITWARYFPDNNSWQRVPRYFVLKDVQLRTDTDDQARYLCVDPGENAAHECRGSVGAEASVEIRIHRNPADGEVYTARIFFSNVLRADADRGMGAKFHIFQPQIRVRLVGLKLVPLTDWMRSAALARGFMTSAVWREIDPEAWVEELGEDEGRSLRELAERTGLKDPTGLSPFHWIDGDEFDQCKEFSRADVRTEYLPVFHLPLPDLDAGSPAAKDLARQDREKLTRTLGHLVDQAREWTEKHGNVSVETIRRMEEGLKLVGEDPDVWLAFTFMNKAMDLQFRWSRGLGAGGEGFRWRPFQLAFVLMVIPDLVKPDSKYRREVVDALQVPTGSGKTEAYLGLLVFLLAYRRLRDLREHRRGDGVAAILRYTLRLLTVQQFRRLLIAVQACEYLRVYGLGKREQVGWLPECGTRCQDDLLRRKGFVWGTTPFSVGLWVGHDLTPNHFEGNPWEPGAEDLLRKPNRKIEEDEDPDPAQILQCPACGAPLSIPSGAVFEADREYRIFWTVCRTDRQTSGSWIEPIRQHLDKVANELHQNQRYSRVKLDFHDYGNTDCATLEVKLMRMERGDYDLGYDDLSRIWRSLVKHRVVTDGDSKEALTKLRSTSWDKPGYFFRWYDTSRGAQVRGGSGKNYDFDLYCPNPYRPDENEKEGCPLRVPWIGGYPGGRIHGGKDQPGDGGLTCCGKRITLNDGNCPVIVQDEFRLPGQNAAEVADRVPIQALTVDEQIYARLPSVIVATVDKFAQLPFNEHIGLLFGDVRSHHLQHGYGRDPCGSVGSHRKHRKCVNIEENRRPRPPELIIQDELHLINGPLGSLVGIYEAAVENLLESMGNRPKYIAASATLPGDESAAGDPLASRATFRLYLRKAAVFPPMDQKGERMFAEPARHGAFRDPPGGLYVGVLSPGKGPMTPLIRIWSTLLHATRVAKARLGDDCGAVDGYFTLVGYFNAVRELAYAVGMYEQDVRERINVLNRLHSKSGIRIPHLSHVELSRRTSSSVLPYLLEELARRNCRAPDAVFTTSMFGTGVDISRLSLMVVDGQPMETSQYVQATGRVGRSRGALIVTFYRATKPRDLSHYEFFAGYHATLRSHTEPITVNPYTEEVARIAGLPVLVAMLRNAPESKFVGRDASVIQRHRKEVEKFIDVLKLRAEMATGSENAAEEFVQIIRGYVDSWYHMAIDETGGTGRAGEGLLYIEYGNPEHDVVFGDPPHRRAGKACVQETTPNSLREIEQMFTFSLEM
jgi:Lhr-like helicase